MRRGDVDLQFVLCTFVTACVDTGFNDDDDAILTCAQKLTVKSTARVSINLPALLLPLPFPLSSSHDAHTLCRQPYTRSSSPLCGSGNCYNLQGQML